MGGLLCFGKDEPEPQIKPIQKRPQLEKVDEVKFKLKKARDTIKNFIHGKNRDIDQLDTKIAEKLPAFKQTGNKKQLIPLLKAKKDLQKMVDNGQVRLKLVNTKLDEVQMQKINAQTINVLDQSNKYIKQIQEQLEQKDWRRVLDEAKNTTQLQWPNNDEETENDPAFQNMWRELGGDAITKTVEKKNVNVNIQSQQQTNSIRRNQALA